VSPAPVLDFIHATSYESIPAEVRHQMHRCLLDLVGVAAAGTATPLSRIMRDHAHRQAPGRPSAPRLLFDGRRVGAAHAALANAATIDSMDGHDGHRLVKGHAGAAILPAALAFLDDGSDDTSTHDLLAALAVGYEVALRAGLVLHDTAADYHSSGAWNALGAAAVGARRLGLDTSAKWHALGIAEYSAPRAPMMRAIAHPTMVKDSSAWGAQAGVTATLLAADGFTGAPAALLQADDAWADLGSSWRLLEQFFKPYPVCRWAHPAVSAALGLLREHQVTPDQIAEVRVTTFEEATRLDTHDVDTTEKAQYSLPFAVAAGLVDGELSPSNVLAGFADPVVQRLMGRVRLVRSDEMSAEFPAVRRAQAEILLGDGRTLASGPTTAKGDPEDQLTDADLVDKFRSYTSSLYPGVAESLAEVILDREPRKVSDLLELLSAPQRR
jgi:2-methylcitrate dehydratase PrpD